MRRPGSGRCERAEFRDAAAPIQAHGEDTLSLAEDGPACYLAAVPAETSEP
jgi:hypothetical protein